MLHFDICISTVLALNVQFCRKEKKTVLALAKKMRKANLFNHIVCFHEKSVEKSFPTLGDGQPFIRGF